MCVFVCEKLFEWGKWCNEIETSYTIKCDDGLFWWQKNSLNVLVRIFICAFTIIITIIALFVVISSQVIFQMRTEHALLITFSVPFPPSQVCTTYIYIYASIEQNFSIGIAENPNGNNVSFNRKFSEIQGKLEKNKSQQPSTVHFVRVAIDMCVYFWVVQRDFPTHFNRPGKFDGFYTHRVRSMESSNR